MLEVEKMKYIVIITSVILILSCATGSHMEDVSRNRITLTSLVEMFENIEKNTKWKMTDEMLWGYFFTHNEPRKLEAATPSLINLGYRVVDIYLADKEKSDEPDLYWLHVEKIEIHTPESLNQRNIEFYKLANELGLDDYDGMDVGPVPQ